MIQVNSITYIDDSSFLFCFIFSYDIHIYEDEELFWGLSLKNPKLEDVSNLEMSPVPYLLNFKT